MRLFESILIFYGERSERKVVYHCFTR